MTKPRLAYISFDIVPAPKGAAVHIAAFSEALAAAFGSIQLVTVSPTADAVDFRELYPQVIQTTLPALGDTLINRVLFFRHSLAAWFQGRRFEAVHIRSIYEGFAIALNKPRYCDKLVFEVNGLPSIELKYRYRAVANDQELLHKLKTQEQICLEAADLILTPSTVTGDYLQTRGIPANKIRVIPNGVDLKIFTAYASVETGFANPAYSPALNLVKNPPVQQPPTDNQPFRMLYFGTLSAWQGVNLAIEALGLVTRDFSACLTVIGQSRDYQVKALKQLATKLGVTDYLTYLEPMSQTQLVKQIHQSDAIVAPLTLNDRNLVQGCCPLKILEGMATGIPVIASDLPVVRELGINGVHFLLVKPSSAKAIKDAVLRLRTDKELGKQLAAAARQHIEKHYTWKQSSEALVAAYEDLGLKRSIRS
jgi:glycosyltransferase involved in cell wall biosynthesis